jgi:signal transduction histidine kinase
MSGTDSTFERNLWPRSFTDVLATIVIAATYFAAGKIGLSMAVVHPSATAVWAPTGIALACFLVGGTRLWPGIYAGAFLVNLTTAGTVATSIGIATGNTLEGLAGAALVRQFARGVDCFEREIDVFRFVVLAGLGATTLSPTMGLTSLAVGGFARWSDFGQVWVTWWLGDASGALIVAPAVLLWARRDAPRWNRERWLEAGALVLYFFVISALLFSRRSDVAVQHVPLQFLFLPLLLWPAFRFGSRETATMVLLVAGVSIWGTARGQGPFASLLPEESLVILQAFMAVNSVTMLVVAALVAERRRAAQARDDILSIAGHELRTPLSTLTLQVENLARGIRQGAPHDTLQPRTEAVRRSARRLATLVEEMLNVSRITAGVIPVRLELLELSVFVREKTNHLLAEIASAQVHVELTADEAVWCRTDKERLSSVVDNLLANAIKYGLGRPVSIRVSRENHSARLSVEDRGVGISRDDQRRIFERFERAVSASHVSGFGLGLWIARQTVEALGGRIHVRSAPGEGSTFTVDLPLEPASGEGR